MTSTAAAKNIRTFKLNEMPPYGIGTWRSSDDTLFEVLKNAIQTGVRHIDCSPLYRNEKHIGEALRKIFQLGLISREDIWITSKLWCTKHRPEDVPATLQQTLNDLQLDYLDLYLIHWPLAVKAKGPNVDDGFGIGFDEHGTMIFDNVTQVDTYKALEHQVHRGLVRFIGISNFDVSGMIEIFSNSSIKPYCNQIECHPYLNQENVIKFGKTLGVRTVAYSPLCALNERLFSEPIIVNIAKKYNVSIIAVLMRFHLDRGITAITKTSSPDRVVENYQSTHSFKLNQEEIDQLLSLGSNMVRSCNISIAKDVKFF